MEQKSLNITYQVEAWSLVKEEMSKLWPLHWEEVANDKDTIKLEPDISSYDYLADSGQFLVVTVRNNGELIGYHWLIIRPHLHYKSSLTAYTDIYFILPEFRKGRIGINLFKFSEEKCKELGVQRIYTASKVKLDKSKIFEHLGYQRCEVVYTKVI